MLEKMQVLLDSRVSDSGDEGHTMRTKTFSIAVIWAGVALSACGTVDDPATDGGDSANVESDGGPATGPATTTPNEDTGTPPATGGMDDTGGSGTGEMTTGVGFIMEPDGSGVGFECDLFAQDCPEGEKCMPWSNDATTWNATRCSPIADNPGQPGDSCIVEGSDISGIDDCDIGAQCWDVDSETNIGTCIAMCTGDQANPICEDPDTSCTIANDGAIVLCLPACDPILQDCPEGQACYPVQEDWICAPDESGEMGVYGDACEFINVCDPGLICLGAASTPNCQGAAGCCTEVCDLGDPTGDAQCTGAAEGQTCQAWYEEGAAPPGFEDIGACALPA